MATTFKKTLAKITVGIVGTSLIYFASVGIYTIIYGNSLAYNMGYSVGYATQLISSVF